MIRARRIVSAAALALALGACDDDAKNGSHIGGVRVLAVQLDKPFVRPGEPVTLRMLLHDGGAPLGAPRPLSIAWFGGCNDPSDDAPGACYERLSFLRNVTADELAKRTVPSALPAGAGVAFGDTFQTVVPADLITRRVPLADETVPRGLSYIFFAACAGDLVPATEERPAAGIPIACVDHVTRARVGADRFVSGYSTVRAYDTLTNQNPLLGATRIGGRVPSDAVCDAATPCQSGEACSSLGRCRLLLPRCTHADQGDCPTHTVDVAIDPTSVEADGTIASGRDRATETLWVAYYTTSGELDVPTQVASQPTTNAGALGLVTGKLRLGPGFTGEARVWAVVHDDRGGVTWTADDVVVR